MYKLNIYQVTQEEVGGIAGYEDHEFAILLELSQM